MATPLKVLTALSASYGAAVSGSEGLQIQQGGIRVSSGVISGSSDLQVGGNATVAGNLILAGDLTVNGTTTTVNTENLLVEDKNIILGNAAGANDTTANGGGISLSGSTVKTFNWVDASDSWTSSEHMDLAVDKSYKLQTVNTLNNGTVNFLGGNALVDFKVTKLVSGSDAAGYIGVGAGTGGLVTGQTGVVMLSGSTNLYGLAGTKAIFNAPTIELSGAVATDSTLKVAGASTLASVTATTVSASVAVSASVFVLADGTQLSSSAQLGGGGGGSGDATKTGVETAYNAVRFVTASVLDGNGYVEVDLTSTANGATYFATADLNKISVDVMTRQSGDSNYWNNDLVSVKLEVSASALWAKIDAPASPNANYRLIAINESDFDVL